MEYCRDADNSVAGGGGTRTELGMGIVKKFGYADLTGIVAALAAIFFVPGLSDPLTYTKLLVLAGGGIALLPVAIWRWRSGERHPWYVTVVASAAGLLVVWGLISMFASGAPYAVSLFGWWGRADGWLALSGAVSIFLAASTLRGPEIVRAMTWLLVGATVAALVGLLQALGVEILGTTQVLSLMGNTNFAAGYFAMVFAIALGRAFMTSAPLWQRAWGGLLALLLAVLAWLTDAIQGPAALAAGLVAFGVALALAYRGRFRLLGLLASAGVVVAGGALLAMSFVGLGPLTRLWAERTFEIRQQYWQSGWNILNALPVFGTGPDGFARYVAEYRPESYVELLGPVLRVSAAHMIPLQIGATMGWAAMAFWLVAMLGSLALVLWRVGRAPVAQPAVTAAAVGALTAYLVQAIVSIDMLPVLVTGWMSAGLAVAAACEPLNVASGARESDSRGQSARKAGGAAVTSGQKRKVKALQAWTPDKPSAPIWLSTVGAIVGFIVAIIVSVQISAVASLANIQSQDQALAAFTSPMTPCPPRGEIASGVLQQVEANLAVPALFEAVAIDPRCSGMLTLEADVALQQGDLDRAADATSQLVEFDPLFAEAWVLRGLYHVQSGDLSSARTDLAEAERVNALYPDPSAGLQRIAVLQQAIENPAAS